MWRTDHKHSQFLCVCVCVSHKRRISRKTTSSVVHFVLRLSKALIFGIINRIYQNDSFESETSKNLNNYPLPNKTLVTLYIQVENKDEPVLCFAIKQYSSVTHHLLDQTFSLQLREAGTAG